MKIIINRIQKKNVRVFKDPANPTIQFGLIWPKASQADSIQDSINYRLNRLKFYVL